MRQLFILLALVTLVSATDITDTEVAAKQVTVPAHVKRPSVKFNPLRYLEMGEKITVIIQVDDQTVKRYDYTPTVAPAPGKGLLFVAKLAIVESVRPDTTE